MQFVFTLPLEVAYPLHWPLTTNDEVNPCEITRTKRKTPSATEAIPTFLRVSERENNSAENCGEFPVLIRPGTTPEANKVEG